MKDANLGTLLEGFSNIPFPESQIIAYVICVDTDKGIYPIYVGSTTRFFGRLEDYLRANFKAQTDFKVGEAIKYAKNRGYSVSFWYKKFENKVQAQQHEQYLKGALKASFISLDDLRGYEYGTAQESMERQKIQDYMKKIFLHMDEIL